MILLYNKEMPPTILPKGLTQTWAQYLYDKVRKCLHCASNRDKVCPKPNPSEKPNSDNPTVNITEREEVDMPGPPTHNSTLSSMYIKELDKLIKVKSDTMLVQKRRKKSELEYRFQCPLCPKKYASYPAL